MMKKIGIILMSFLCVVFLSNSWADKDINIEVKTGIHGVGVHESKVKVGEYDVLNIGVQPDISFFLNGKINDLYFSGSGTYYEEEDQQYSASVDIKRYLTQEFTYYRFKHWLDHDPLTNLYAAATTGTNVIPPLVTYTDIESGRDYSIVRSERESKTTLRIPLELPFELKTFFNYRTEARWGERQALTMSKCSACHVVSRSKRIDEYTEDYNPGFIATYRSKKARVSFSYEYLDREFRENAMAPENYYDRAVHPGSGSNVFDDRVQYQNTKLPYAHSPRSRKYSHIVKLDSYVPSLSTGMFIGSVYSETENKEEDLKFNLKTIFTRLSSAMIPGLSFNVHFRYLDLANQSIFVDTNEPVSNAGTNAGHTWADPSHGGTYNTIDPDFTRNSAMSRRQYEVGLDMVYLLMKGITLRGSYEWREIKRDHYYVTSNDKETKEHRAKLAINARFKPPVIERPIRATLTYKYKSIDAPFANVKAAFKGETTITSNGAFSGTQYWELHEMRNLTLTNLPTLTHEIRFDTTVPVYDRLSVTAFYRWIEEKNKAVEWANKTHMPSLSIWYAPLDKLSFTVSYLYKYGKTNSLLCVPVYDG